MKRTSSTYNAAVFPASTLTARAGALSWLYVGLLLVLLTMLYAHVAIKLVHDWIMIPDFSHGFLIPFFVGYLLWQRRSALKNVQPKGSWAGVGLVVVGLFVLLAGVYGAELFLSRISFVLLATGLVWAFGGLPFLRVMRFPILVLLLAIPIPAVIFNQITFPLQLMASQLAASILPFFGVPVLREGNVMQLASIQLEVAEACSGIRSLLSLFTVAVMYGYFLESSRSRRVLLALASLPIAVTANVARIVGTGLCVQYWDPDKALGFFHEFSGWLIFVVSLFCLFAVHKALQHFGPKSQVIL